MDLKLKIWRKILVFIFFYCIYHLIRDVLQDIFDIHNPFTEFLHYKPDQNKLPAYFKWISFGGYRKWITFPIEIFLILIIPKIKNKNSFSRLDGLIAVVILFTVVLWLILFSSS